MKAFRIAVIPGDGVGIEVIEATWSVLAAAAARHRFELTQDRYPWSCNACLGAVLKRMAITP
jgi:tartrate dehydrogenase/decarboxylase/D-malate dehydrogenase